MAALLVGRDGLVFVVFGFGKERRGGEWRTVVGMVGGGDVEKMVLCTRRIFFRWCGVVVFGEREKFRVERWRTNSF